MSRAVSGKNRKWLLADKFLFLPETIGREPTARWSGSGNELSTVIAEGKRFVV